MVNQKLNIAILGLGREGLSLLRFLRRRYGSKATLTVLDRDPSVAKSHSHVLKNVRMRTGINYLKNLNEFDIIFRAPGVHYLTSELQAARRAGVAISSATKLFFDELRHYALRNTHSPIIIGVTGTKGKGTVSTLIFEMLRAAKKRVVLAGNIGLPMLDVLEKVKKADAIVLELSSFQLQDLHQSPDIAVILPITPDHLEIHKNFAEYVGAKGRIARHQTKEHAVFFLSASKIAPRLASESLGKKFSVSGENLEGIITPSELKIPGFHNVENAAIATRVAQHLKVPAATIRKVLKHFRGLPHRLQLVRTIRIPDYSLQTTHYKLISFYDDSASTNPSTAIAAVKAFKDPIIWIGGGLTKGFAYDPLTPVLKKQKVREAVLFGENKYQIERAIFGAVPVAIAKDLKAAVREAFDTAKTMQTETGNIRIIFSPASASFDMFKNYVDRGEQFQKIVKALK